MAGETATAAVAAVVAWDVVVELRRGRRLGHPRALTQLRTLTRFAPSEAEARTAAAPTSSFLTAITRMTMPLPAQKPSLIWDITQAVNFILMLLLQEPSPAQAEL